MLIRNQLVELPHSHNGDGGLCTTPKEVLERMSAADPYFQASSGTVNPFTQLKLPARSQLVVQEGGRCCHSLPDASHLPPPPMGGQLAASDSSLCPPGSPTPPLHHHCPCLCGAGGAGPGGGSPRSEAGSGGGGTGAGVVRRRGSGESGFFSVDGHDRDLCLSYSELSTASLMSTEDEDGPPLPLPHGPPRSSSVVTDSSEDLSSLGCCHDHGHWCDPPDPPGSGGCHADIRSIVEFFERGYGSIGTAPDGGLGGATMSTDSGTFLPRPSGIKPSGAASVLAQRHSRHSWAITAGTSGGNKSFCTKDIVQHKTSRRGDRPKLFITEGTVRAKRDIFEAK